MRATVKRVFRICASREKELISVVTTGSDDQPEG
jgi:hypothetical protein